jgi:mannose/cellobiose epimerase-like protein (N-acyl-D-glucosamine 2-epimerase family)
MKQQPDFRSPQFLRDHILRTMAFYDGRCIDPAGGFYQHYRDDGSLVDAATRHLVSSTRFVVTHAWAARHFPDHTRAQDWRAAVRHGLAFLQGAHAQDMPRGHAWTLRVGPAGQVQVTDATLHAYGLAFVLLAHAEALRAGVDEAAPGLDATWQLLERHFWEPDAGLYADEITPDGMLQPYRGQNANMHACEATLAAFAATDEVRYLERAEALASAVTRRLATAEAPHLICEHYRRDEQGRWQPDWAYHRDDPTHLFRPWGYQVGHHAEWAKLLLTLERQLPGLAKDNWLVHRARELFDVAVRIGWDKAHGGLVYGFAPDETHPDGRHFAICDGHKYHWVQAETLAAAARLGERTLDGGYWDWYDRIWAYAWQHFVDHEHGAWYRILAPDNARITDEKSPPGKVDYHNLGACYEALAVLDPSSAS